MMFKRFATKKVEKIKEKSRKNGQNRKELEEHAYPWLVVTPEKADASEWQHAVPVCALAKGSERTKPHGGDTEEALAKVQCDRLGRYSRAR